MPSHIGATNGANGVNGNHAALGAGDNAAGAPRSPPGPPAPLAAAEHHEPLGTDRDGVTTAFKKFAQSIHSSRRPLPTQLGDGTVSTRRRQTGLAVDLKHLGKKDFKTLLDLLKSKIHGSEPVDDKTMLMERVIQIVAGLPTRSRTRVLLTNQLIGELWGSLEHPVLNYIGAKSMYRSADGSNNNPLWPSMGAAGTTYARSVRPTIMPPGALPDPGLIYDSVMRRSSSGYRKHPNNVSSILWYWATIIIHDLFWTDSQDPTKSKTSSYLDLSPLYGSNQDMQNTIRTFRDGMLKPDAYADKRLHGMPAGVSVLLVMFNRFHNNVAKHLAMINEGGRFTRPEGPRPTMSGPQPVDNDKKEHDPHSKSEAAWKKYDEDLFQTARLVTSGLYINITLVDYVRNIVNLNRCDTTWTLDPRQEMGRDAGTAKGAEAGTGNVVSAEFNLAYRWHSCISEKDDRWIQDFYQDLFDKPAHQVDMRDMAMGFRTFDASIPNEPADRTFGHYKRDAATGKFKDDDLVECITSSIEDCAGAFGARNVPISMRPVEILGIMQARRWHVSGLNEFRRHFGLKPYETFEELNSDPEVASCLSHLYEHPDFVELYPGLVAEEAKEPMAPGVGIAPTYTISRVVLSDAVCLVRGDRHYTTDYSPRSLTSWGFNEVQYDLNVNHGCVFYKLLIRAFPDHFKQNSVYAHYPMVIPAENRRILESLKRDHLFTWDRPKYSPARVEVDSSDGCDETASAWRERISSLLGRENMIRVSVGESYSSDKLAAATKVFYKLTVDRLFKEKSYVLGGTHMVDIVRDIGNVANVTFASSLLNLPLKTGSSPKGVYSEEELHSVLALIYITLFLNEDPVKEYPLRQAAKAISEQLCKVIESNTGAGGRGFKSFFGSASRADSVQMYGTEMIKGWGKGGMSSSDIALGHILPTASHIVAIQGAAFAQAVDFYLSPAGKQHLPKIQALASQASSGEDDKLLLGYIMEGIRLSRRSSTSDDRLESEESLNVTPTRAPDEHGDYGLGANPYLPRDVHTTALTELFRAVFSKKNIRRAPGPQGELKKVAQEDGSWAYLTEDWSSITPLPTSMRVCWDEA
ncbi:linoleate diol synthase [Diaporthe helianthi]|uniref:Linoleate diol synthase n=1 Tax=Diaporthe helianthi TaxID=158607 RepID=A0A2P5HJF3_DIAHE|nr:linoleate diol synthase [Diaporthe helianthi]